MSYGDRDYSCSFKQVLTGLFSVYSKKKKNKKRFEENTVTPHGDADHWEKSKVYDHL